jgi:serine/threonine protein kinase
VPFEPTILDAFEKFERISLNELFKRAKDRANFLDLLLKMLAYVPDKRITAKEAMNHPFFKEYHRSDAVNPGATN